MSATREPSKRLIKPPTQPLLDIEFGESSDDSDFKIEDHREDSDDDSFNSDGKEGSESGMEDSESDSDESDVNLSKDNIKEERSINEIVEQAKLQFNTKSVEELLICCACLGDRSDHSNEIVECDGCGVTVHEGCYGVSDTQSISSAESLCPTEPWFCEACKAGVENPSCELCPNSGGIFKATDVGRWVHLVCALYVPGVAFGEVERLTNVTLFEMPYSKWGAKDCGLCEDDRFSRTGVHIGCDAGMCRTFFHVTCAQREGLLSEAHSEEVDQADPFYAHCKLHTDKTLMRRRRRNYVVMQYRMKQKRMEHARDMISDNKEAQRIKRKLAKKKAKFTSWRGNAPEPWVPTQKMPRLLTTSAYVCRVMWKKAELMGIDAAAVETKEAQSAVMCDINKKWHIQPAFSFEFTGYYLDRNNRIPAMKIKLEELLETNVVLSKEQEDLKMKYESLVKEKEDTVAISTRLKDAISKLHEIVKLITPDKHLPALDDVGKQPRSTHPLSSTMQVPTAAALKAGVGYPIARTNYKGQQQTEPRIHTKSEQTCVTLTSHECGICLDKRDQHLLAKCDTCNRFYHLSCLNPPLTRMPKKNKIMGWQCSECDKGSSDSEPHNDIEAPRRLRNTSVSRDDSKLDPLSPRVSIRPLDSNITPTSKVILTTPPRQFVVQDEGEGQVVSGRSSKKRRREKHERYSPELLVSSGSGGKKHKKKKKVVVVREDEQQTPQIRPGIKIKIKAIPCPGGQGVSADNQTMFVASSTSDPILPVKLLQQQKQQFDMIQCDACFDPGDSRTLVKCDECMKCYHFSCLDPPLKKTPKRRGYSWHCADCDPTESDN